MSKVNIYKLCHPDTGAPMYVGASKYPPEVRLKKMFQEVPHQESCVHDWLLYLDSDPKPELIRTVDEDVWRDERRETICELRSAGAPLVNGYYMSCCSDHPKTR